MTNAARQRARGLALAPSTFIMKTTLDQRLPMRDERIVARVGSHR